MKVLKLRNSTNIAFVDDEDYNYVNKFHWHEKYSNGICYARTNMRVSEDKWIGVYLHRMIMNFPTSIIDHKDRNGLNCTRENLRIATRAQNRANSINSRISNYRGVYKRGNKYRACIRINKVLNHLGTFDTAINAAKAYDEAAKKHFKEFAVCNF